MMTVDALESWRVRTPADIVAAAQLACLLEASAPKPGNVSPGRCFEDIAYEDFLASAAAIGGPLAGAGIQPLGTTVRLAIESTARWTPSNTNLGIVLLLAPLARAAHLEALALVRLKTDAIGDPIRVKADTTRSAVEDGSRAFRHALTRVLEATTVADAREVYAAIRLAAPGGLGRVAAQDVAHDPDVTLVDAMRLAAARDGIAREYATNFEVTFETGVPALDRSLRDGCSWSDAIVETFLTILARRPDTHVIRRGGPALAEEVSRRACEALEAGGVRSTAGRRAIDEMDQGLRDARHTANPGTTADLTAAATFVVLLGGGWVRPRMGRALSDAGG